MVPIDAAGDGGRRIVKRLENEPLPRLVPERVDDTLRVGVEGLVLSIESDTDIHTYRPDWHFLARWWVNGKPFLPSQLTVFPGDENGMVRRGKRLRVGLDLDARRLGAKSGDRIGLQLLYCPHGWSWVTSGARLLRALPAREEFAGVSRLSNRVELVVP
jgi:hypothetical protein